MIRATVMAFVAVCSGFFSSCNSEQAFFEDVETTVDKSEPAIQEEPRESNVESETIVITRGSFSVYTVPSDPAVEEDYRLHISVALGVGIKDYEIGDLNVILKGSDGYRLFVRNGECRQGNADEGQELSFEQMTSLCVLAVDDSQGGPGFSVKVPGAEAKVKDQIEIESKILKETQSIELSF